MLTKVQYNEKQWQRGPLATILFPDHKPPSSWKQESYTSAPSKYTGDFFFEHLAQHWQSGCQEELCLGVNHFWRRSNLFINCISFSIGVQRALDPFYLQFQNPGSCPRVSPGNFSSSSRKDHAPPSAV